MTIKVRFKRDFRGYREGQVADVQSEAAGTWFERGIAEPVDGKSFDAPPRDKAIRKPKRKKSLTTKD